ncbi:pitrilysin family protein [soil metagenome]
MRAPGGDPAGPRSDKKSDELGDGGPAGHAGHAESAAEIAGAGAATVTLPNGLELILKVDRAAPVVSAQTWVRTGSIHEGEFRGAGVSHLVEHLVFKGSSQRDGNAIARDVQEAGGYINAYTSFDRTVYWIDGPADCLAVALDVLGDLVRDATMPADEFEREKDVIRREIAMGNDDPGRSGSRLLFSTAFFEHPFREPVIGHRELFDQITREDAVAYYRRRYLPNNTFLVVVGDFDADEIRKQVEERFGSWQRGFLPSGIIPAEPRQMGQREAHEEFQTKLSKLSLAWRIPGVTHPDMPALDVLATVLGEGRSSRLYREVRDGKGLAHSVGAFAYTPSTEGLFAAYADTDPDNRDAAKAAILDTVAEVQRHGIEEAELDKARKCALADHFGSLVSTRGQAADLGSNWLLARNLDFTRHYVRVLAEVTTDEVVSAARRYLVPGAMTYTSLNPKGRARITAPATISGSAAAVTSVVLPNGLTLVVREDRRLPLVSMHAAFLGGVLAETPETNGITKLMAASLLKGTRTRSASAIADAIEGVGGHVSAGSGNNTFAASVGVMATDLAIGAEILGDLLANASFPIAEVERERDAQIASIRADHDQLVTVAFRALRNELFGGHPYAMARKGTEESVAALHRDDVEAFCRSRAVGTNGVVGVFGDVDPSAVRDLGEEHLGTLTRGQRAFPDRPAAPPQCPAVTRDITRDKEQAVLAVGFRTEGIHHEDRLVLDLLDEACSDMASRLFIRIREELGLAYYVTATQMPGLGAGAFVFYLGTSPDQLALAERELVAEIRSIAEHGLTDEEFARAKKTYLGKHLLELQSNASLVQTCTLDELYGFGHSHYLQLASQVEAITPERARAAAARYFGTTGPTVVRVRPPAGS